MIVKKPMEHWNSVKICADCVNTKCKADLMNDFMRYSQSCERYECTERMVEVKEKICNVSEVSE